MKPVNSGYTFRSIRELNLSGNQLLGLPSGALYLNLKSISIANNYMHPLLWRENAKNSPQRLQDMAAHVMVTENLVQCYPDLPEQVVHYLETGHVPCDACRGPRFGPGLVAIRPCEYIFGIKNLPFLFNCCSAECVYIFRRGIADPIELKECEDHEEVRIDPDDIQHVPRDREDDFHANEGLYSPFSPVRRDENYVTDN